MDDLLRDGRVRVRIYSVSRVADVGQYAVVSDRRRNTAVKNWRHGGPG